ncbi:unnamed protein product [Lymnaea stagnalis]|uniref:Uncharacterized protein n=1 Tax=Lymnaea stagnalis TaxID=6523 RepID=A0AAV2H1T9_LYMST
MSKQQTCLSLLPAWQAAKVPSEVFCQERCGHNAVCINNELIIWGGYNNLADNGAQYCPTNVLWSFSIELDRWLCVKTSAELPECSSGACSAILWPYWYLFCGHNYNGNSNSISRIDLCTLKWECLKVSGKIISPRDKASSWVFLKKIYCFGGFGPRLDHDFLWCPDEDTFTDDPGVSLPAEAEISRMGWNDQLVYFDTEKLEWVLVHCQGEKPSSRAAHATVCINTKVYLFGGRHSTHRLNDLHCLDLESHTWSGMISCTGNIPEKRSWHSMTHVGKNEIMMYGGFSGFEIPLDDIWMLNVESFSWTSIKHSTGLPRLWHTASINSLGDILIFGGCSNNILDIEANLETSDKVILIRTEPFSLERLCLHSVYKNKKYTYEGWNLLPKCLQEWLRLKSAADQDKSYAFRSNVLLGLGPSLSDLALLSEEEAEKCKLALRLIV